MDAWLATNPATDLWRLAGAWTAPSRLPVVFFGGLASVSGATRRTGSAQQSYRRTRTCQCLLGAASST